MKLLTSLLLTLLTFQTSYAGPCEKYFAFSPLISWERKVGTAVLTSKFCDYKRSWCGDNIFRLITRLKKKKLPANFLENSQVLFVFDKEFYYMTPSREILPNGKGWAYHVVLSTPAGIIDLDDSNSRKFKALYPRAYFDRYFPHHRSELNVAPFPALRYYENMSGEDVVVTSNMDQQPNGWVLEDMGDFISPSNNSPTGFVANYSQKAPFYYITAQHAHWDYPVMSLEDYLRARQPTAKLPTF